LFRQQRIGRNLVPFDIYKFRTMVIGAPDLGGQITQGTTDPRITAIGSLLRKTKLDELPQLLNVLLGDMSLVGSRPEVPRFVAMFPEEHAEILRLRPGITGLAAVRYRHEAEILSGADDPEQLYAREVLPAKLALEKEYVANQSFLLDLKLILLTLWLVVTAVMRFLKNPINRVTTNGSN
jgi:lipopolysaccharide/colanic/teichoic acid biosynthesis glycosyltransferase